MTELVAHDFGIKPVEIGTGWPQHLDHVAGLEMEKTC